MSIITNSAATVLQPGEFSSDPRQGWRQPGAIDAFDSERAGDDVSESTVIMGRVMQSFGLSHLEALTKIRSGFLWAKRADFADLIRAAYLCSQPAGNVTGCKGFFASLRLCLWLRSCRKLDWNAELFKMQKHIEAGLDSVLAMLTAMNAKGVK